MATTPAAATGERRPRPAGRRPGLPHGPRRRGGGSAPPPRPCRPPRRRRVPTGRGDRREGGGAARLTNEGDQLSVSVEITCPPRWSPAVRPGGSPAVP